VKKSKKAKKFRKKSERAEFLLGKLAETLDECHANKINIEMRLGVVCSKYGYVLPVGRKWVVRTMIDLGYPLSDDDDD
jgi:hypothetical protein